MRYTIDMTGTNPEKFAIVDTFTGKAVIDGLDAEGAEGYNTRKNAEFDEALALANQITRFVNRAGSQQGEEFVAAMARQHRTLQQGFTGLCCAWIEHLAKLEGPGQYDLRNEASVEFAKAVVASPVWQKHFLPYI